MAVHLCVLLWANPDAEAALTRYEEQVLELMADHGARVLQRVRSAGHDGAPTEVQILEYPSEDALEAYVAETSDALRWQGLERLPSPARKSFRWRSLGLAEGTADGGPTAI